MRGRSCLLLGQALPKGCIWAQEHLLTPYKLLLQGLSKNLCHENCIICSEGSHSFSNSRLPHGLQAALCLLHQNI